MTSSTGPGTVLVTGAATGMYPQVTVKVGFRLDDPA